MLTAGTEEAPILGVKKRRLSVRRMCSAHCSIEKRDHNEEGKLFTLSSMMQDSYCYLTAHTQWAQSHSDDLHKSTIADCFECYVSRSSRERDHNWFSCIKHQDCSVIATESIHACTSAVWHHSHSQPLHQCNTDLSVLKLVSKSIYL